MSQYGYCPRCAAPGKTRERRPDGNDTCENGHTYKSTNARAIPWPDDGRTGTHLFDLVTEFHNKHGFTVARDLREPVAEHTPEMRKACDEALSGMAEVLKTFSQRFKNGTLERGVPAHPTTYDDRLMRTHLMIEELAETIEGLAERSPIKTLDGAADLSYVVNGTCVAFGLPLEEAEREVHDSNMTKAVRKQGDVRLRDKGEAYRPPDLRRILNGTKYQLDDFESARRSFPI